MYGTDNNSFIVQSCEELASKIALKIIVTLLLLSVFGGDGETRTHVPRVSTCGFTPGLTDSSPERRGILNRAMPDTSIKTNLVYGTPLSTYSEQRIKRCFFVLGQLVCRIAQW